MVFSRSTEQLLGSSEVHDLKSKGSLNISVRHSLVADRKGGRTTIILIEEGSSGEGKIITERLIDVEYIRKLIREKLG